MHAWILIFWLTNYPVAGLNSQEFVSKAHCLKAGVEMKKHLPYDVTFMCVEK